MADELFREEALEHHRRPPRRGGLLRVEPKWIGRAYRLICLASLLSLVILVVGRANDYARGPAVVRAVGQLELTAKRSGTVVRVEVQPGKPVRKGQALVRLDSDAEDAELAQVKQQRDAELLKLLRDPSDEAAKLTISALNARYELALRHTEERVLKAPEDGTVTGIRAHEEQHVNAGDPLVSFSASRSGFELLAVVPGRYRPVVKPGTPLHLEMAGFRFSNQRVVIDEVDAQVMGPLQVKRELGASVADSLEVDGPSFLVRARLPEGSFTVLGERYDYFDGMAGTARVVAYRGPVLLMLVPWLRTVLPDGL